MNIRRKRMSIYKHPLKSFKLFATLFLEDIKNCWFSNVRIISVIIGAIILTLCTTYIIWDFGVLIQMIDILIFSTFWIVLGILSSIGLGSGLNTGYLYLFPKIAQFVLISSECKGVPRMTPHRLSLFPRLQCSKEESQNLSMIGIWRGIILESILWGIGTAVGELPPFWISR